MTDIASITSSTTAGSITSAASVSKSMGKDDFLQLLVAQLQNQDPLNPQDPTEFTAQLAQYSSLEQQFTMNEYLASMADANKDTQRLTAMSLIGRTVTAESSSITLAPHSDTSLAERLGYTPGELYGDIGYRLDAAASSVKLDIFDSGNKLVATINAPASGVGDHFVSWDGKGSSGNLLPAGDYTVQVSAKQANAQEETSAVAAKSIATGLVAGVELGATGNVLVTSTGSFDMADVTSVSM